jgi:molybdopterin synthase sulfur carrier subunit
MVTIKFFASLREEMGKKMEEVLIHEGSTVEEVLEVIKEAYPRLRKRRNLVIAVNGIRSGLEQVLKEGDIVALLPPVSGG